MKFLLFLSLALFSAATLTNCTTSKPPPAPVADIGCKLEKTVANAFAQSIQAGASCTNPDVIQSDLLAKIGALNLCKDETVDTAEKAKLKGPIANFACPLVVNAALNAVGSKIPPTWGCSPGSDAIGVKAMLTAACVSLSPY